VMSKSQSAGREMDWSSSISIFSVGGTRDLRERGR
jgi:hypothetical protein